MPGNLQSIPASVIASWPPPNYNDPERRAWMPVFGGILQGVTTVLFTTRLGLRAGGQAGGFGLDDVRQSEDRGRQNDADLARRFSYQHS